MISFFFNLQVAVLWDKTNILMLNLYTILNTELNFLSPLLNVDMCRMNMA